jgi:hypothetical protein
VYGGEESPCCGAGRTGGQSASAKDDKEGMGTPGWVGESSQPLQRKALEMGQARRAPTEKEEGQARSENEERSLEAKRLCQLLEAVNRA